MAQQTGTLLTSQTHKDNLSTSLSRKFRSIFHSACLFACFSQVRSTLTTTYADIYMIPSLSPRSYTSYADVYPSMFPRSYTRFANFSPLNVAQDRNMWQARPHVLAGTTANNRDFVPFMRVSSWAGQIHPWWSTPSLKTPGETATDVCINNVRYSEVNSCVL